MGVRIKEREENLRKLHEVVATVLPALHFCKSHLVSSFGLRGSKVRRTRVDDTRILALSVDVVNLGDEASLGESSAGGVSECVFAGERRN